jgi:hypothetical protein
MKDYLEVVNKVTAVVLAYRLSRKKKLKGIKRFHGKKMNHKRAKTIGA